MNSSNDGTQATGEKMKKLLLISAVAASTLMASGYKVPEQSLNSTALAGAYVSNANTADTTYYNPANMAFMSEDKHFEMNLMYISLNEVSYDGNVGPMPASSESQHESFVIPQLYLVSAPLGEDEDVRLGLSINAPAGLSKRWSEGVPYQMAEEFSLTVIEVNPTISYRFADGFSIAGGARFVYAKGAVKVPGVALPGPAGGSIGTLDVEGSSWNMGWNAAVAYKPFDVWGMALTYRSKVDLDVDGGQKVSDPLYTAMGLQSIRASVSVPLPAVVTFATDFDITSSTNLEFVYERTFWSAYDELQFNFGGQAAPADPKDWDDTNTFRLGLTQGLGDSVDLMIGLAYDETPIPAKTVGFELPDSDAYIGSIGVRWAVNEKVDIGAAFLYDSKSDRTIDAGDQNTKGLNGTFGNSYAMIGSLGLGYKF